MEQIWSTFLGSGGGSGTDLLGTILCSTGKPVADTLCSRLTAVRSSASRDTPIADASGAPAEEERREDPIGTMSKSEIEHLYTPCLYMASLIRCNMCAAFGSGTAAASSSCTMAALSSAPIPSRFRGIACFGLLEVTRDVDQPFGAGANALPLHNFLSQVTPDR